jgi:hypothetical protein
MTWEEHEGMNDPEYVWGKKCGLDRDAWTIGPDEEGHVLGPTDFASAYPSTAPSGPSLHHGSFDASCQ